MGAGLFDITWITNQKGANNYPTGKDIDLSHCAEYTCVWNYPITRAGLNYVKCRTCGADAIIDANRSGRIVLACRLSGD
jgi:hypothetical protein